MMNRYFDFPDAKITLLVEVKPGSAAALATPELIRDRFKQKGAVREIARAEYKKLTDIYICNAPEGEREQLERLTIEKHTPIDGDFYFICKGEKLLAKTWTQEDANIVAGVFTTQAEIASLRSQLEQVSNKGNESAELLNWIYSEFGVYMTDEFHDRFNRWRGGGGR